jgi:hypothetical protein
MKQYILHRYYIKNLIMCCFFGLVFIFAFAIPSHAELRSVTDLEKMIADLRAQIATLQKKVVDARNTSSNVAICTPFTSNLKPGTRDADTNGEVGKLQRFLTSTGDYTHGSITGFYGPATMGAVQKWQRAQGIVSSGSPELNGYGSVGPATRAKIRAACVSNGDNMLYPSSKSYSLADVEWVKLDSTKTVYDGPSIYTIRLENEKQVVVSVCTGRGCTQANIDTAFRNSGYTGDITKLMALAKKVDPSTPSRPCISPNLTTNTYPPPDISDLCKSSSGEVDGNMTPPQALNVTNSELKATANFSLTNGCQGYTVSWGDGTQEDKVAPSSKIACTLANSVIKRIHTYTNPGTYTVTLSLLQGATAPKIYTKTVTVAHVF